MFGLMKTMHRSKDKCKMGFENRQISIVVFDLWNGAYFETKNKTFSTKTHSDKYSSFSK